ncbi:MAG: hypothetical protein KDK37_17755, partial [Leptospiraceae bacterium]|nr:hypothetical protein [Leptospiraceae bacterium]
GRNNSSAGTFKVSASPGKAFLRDSLLVRLVIILLPLGLLWCSSRPPSFRPMARHPLADSARIVQPEIQIEGPGDGAVYRARLVAYNGDELVAASVIGPWFDAEKNPAGIRPLQVSDGYFMQRYLHRLALPAEKGSVYLRLFRMERPDSMWQAETIDDEIMAVHIQMNQGNRNVCESSYWSVHMPVRSIIHCYLPAPASIQRLRLRLSRTSADSPWVLEIPDFSLSTEQQP